MPTPTMLEKKLFVHPKALAESDDIGDHTRVRASAHVVTGNDLERVQKLRILRDHGSPAKYRWPAKSFRCRCISN